MQKAGRRWALPLVAALTISGCAAAERPPASQGQTYAGWYTQHAGRSSFQPCGRAAALLVSESAELRARAKTFGLDEDTPVYVRLSGVASVDRNEFTVARVEQFGSPTPVRDCAMTGLQIQSAGPSGNR